MAKHRKMVEREDGWCDWVAPTMRGYKMGCCDCGLVHELEFAVFTVNDLGKGWHEVLEDDIENGRVRFRARRHERSTAQVRRHMKKGPSNG